MSISQTGAGPVTRHEPRVTFGVTRWLSYRVRSLPVTHALPTASLRDSPGSGTQDGAEGGGERGGEGGGKSGSSHVVHHHGFARPAARQTRFELNGEAKLAVPKAPTRNHRAAGTAVGGRARQAATGSV